MDDPHGLFDDGPRLLASGFRWTEGPVWWSKGGALLFSDTVDACIYKWTKRTGRVSLLVDESGGFDGSNVRNMDVKFEPGSNGMALAGDGDELVICQHPTHRVVRATIASLDAGGGKRFCDLPRDAWRVLADHSPEGRPLNSPNDVVVDSGGAVFFTDPIYGFLRRLPGGMAPENVLELGWHPDQPYLDEMCHSVGAGYKGVFRLRQSALSDAKDGSLECVTRSLERPNGLAFSPDGKLLWVANSAKDAPSWTAFTVGDAVPFPKVQAVNAGTLKESLCLGPGVSDGFKIDGDGLLWASVPGGVAVVDPERQAVLARITLGTNVSNLEFGEDGDVFITGLGHLWLCKRRARAERCRVQR
jgi:gluconolactonase